MGNNRLDDLSIDGLEDASRELGSINTYAFDRIYSVTQENDFEAGATVGRLCQSDLRIVAGYHVDDGERLVEIVLRQAVQLHLPDLPQFGELEVRDVSANQMEGIRFEVVDHGENSFRCFCQSMAIKCL